MGTGKTLRLTHVASAVLALALATGAVQAQTYPARPVRVIVPFPPGGVNDLLGRVVAQRLTETMGQSFVIDNRSGASGVIGAEVAARAAADGYTLLVAGTSTLSILPHMRRKLPYDPVRDFAPVGLLATGPNLLVVHPSLPVKNLRDVIALAKKRPGQLNVASVGVGTPPHLAAELFKQMAGVSVVIVQYKGGGPAITDLMGGQVELFFAGLAAALPHLPSGRIKPVAVTSRQRNAQVPQVPTLDESGLPGYEIGNWYALLAPARTPAEVIARLNAELVKQLATAEMQKRIVEVGAQAQSSSPEELAAFQRNEVAKWGKVIAAAGIKPE